jgi:hypothetical protein
MCLHEGVLSKKEKGKRKKENAGVPDERSESGIGRSEIPSERSGKEKVRKRHAFKLVSF